MKHETMRIVGEEQVETLFQQTYSEKPIYMVKLADSGSNRLYFRMSGKLDTVIGVYNNDRKENEAFFSFTRTFKSLGLPVPELLSEDIGNNCYLLSDLGDQTLFSFLVSQRDEKSGFPSAIQDLYQNVLKILPLFQINGGGKIDYSKCYPRYAFDRQSMLWDLNYFKYYFLKLAHIPFDEQALEEDFQRYTTFLLLADADYFMYRDFQSRNIMLVKNEPYFIDYQGGRRGPLQYDVASLLYDAKANLPQEVRDKLLGFYLDEVDRFIQGRRQDFLDYFPAFVLIRILQALGAYGYRGYYEKKSHFLQSIPFALANLRTIRALWQANKFGVELPTLFHLLNILTEKQETDIWITDKKAGIQMPLTDNDQPATGNQQPATKNLTVTINSFSYKNGIPSDPTENGGGFVFDCRALPNPGRFDAFKQLTGNDQAVIDFLKNETDVDLFMQNVLSLVDQSVSRYLERGFQHLFVNFGCTGGQHRSVYCAEKMREYLMERYNIRVNLNHKNLPLK